MRKRFLFPALASTTLLLAGLPGHTYEAGGGNDNGNDDTVAIGDDAETKDDNAVAIGKDSTAEGEDSVAIGADSDVDGKKSIAIGEDSKTEGENSIALGEDATACGKQSTSLGSGALSAPGEISEGKCESFDGDDSEATALGANAKALSAKATAVGEEAKAYGKESTAIGSKAKADGEQSVAIGNDSEAAGKRASALGYKARAEHENSTALGANASTTRDDQIVLGSSSTELTISNLSGTGTAVTYVEDDGTLKRSSVSIEMLEGFDGRVNELGDGVAASTALTSAMGALPVISPDSKLTCGVGTGAYSGATAVALGCATRINDRFSMNIGGSKVLQGSSSYDYGSGSLDSFAARAGLVMRLGKLHRPNSTGEELQARLQQVEAENKEINEKYESVEQQNKLIQQENELIQQQNKQLMARLERLEAIALGIQPKTDELAVVPGALAK